MSEQITPDWPEILAEAIHAALVEMHTGLPAKVIAYDKEKQTVDVQVLLKRAIKDEDTDGEIVSSIAPLNGVPVQFWCAGGFAITFPIKPGNLVYLSFCERSIDILRNSPSGSEVDPVDCRKFSLSDAVAIPAPIQSKDSPIPSLDADNLRIGKLDGSTILEITPAGDVRFVVQGTMSVGNASAGVAREGDSIQVADELLQWVKAVAANPMVGIPFVPDSITGLITSSSNKLKSE
jgi:hypothetical protein